ncbi:MAG TPA: transposase [Acidobacteriaceae bacterium]|jgi:putative transposase|nr:transposase [Acidobacteriaceae bacterium]
MTDGLIRYQQAGHQHFVTFSCSQRRPLLRLSPTCELFERSLERTRIRYGFLVLGYVVMPEHVHLLLTEPEKGSLATALQALKISVARQRPDKPFWSARYYDFNVFSEGKRIEKLKYIHRNPVARGLVARPEGWPWSSYRHYLTGVRGRVEIESWWAAHAGARGEAEVPHLPNPGRCGAPDPPACAPVRPRPIR